MSIFKKAADGQKRQQEEQVQRSPTESSDELLINEIAGGAIWAMETLYERYYRILYSFACHIVTDRQIAEDLLQEAFLSVWRHAHSYSSQSGAVRTWLISIVRHRAIDYLRGLQRRETVSKLSLDEVDYIEPVASPDVWDAVWQSAQRSLIREALGCIPREQRMVIELAYFQGWTHTEIADGCQIPLGTVKARMRLGLLHLKRILEQKDIREN